MTESTTHLPEDLIVEILSRVPAVSLARFRSTSKGWNALVKEGRFAKKHFDTAPRSSLVIMLIDYTVYLASVDLHGIHNNVVKVTNQLSPKDPLCNFSKEVEICNVFHCDGLLLCSTTDNRVVVWNPCSGETRWIQPRNSYKRFDLGKSSCNKYKILRVDQSGYLDPCLAEYEIYDFTSNSWRSIGETRDWFILRSKGRGMSVNGNTYWLACDQDLLLEDFLLSFDFSTERFGSVSLPGDHLSYYAMALSVTREEQKLCMIASRSRQLLDMDVWLATKIESTGATSWSKFLTVGKASIQQPFCFCSGMSFLADQENKVLVCPGKNGVSESFLHIVGEDKDIQVDHHDAGSLCSYILSYVPTLVQIQPRKAPRTKEKKKDIMTCNGHTSLLHHDLQWSH